MRESSPNLAHPQRKSSIRFRKRQEEVKQQFLKNRRSGDFGHSHNNGAVNITDDGQNVGTLDLGPASAGIQHNLRPLLRKKYREDPLSYTEDDMGRRWGEGRRKRNSRAKDIKNSNMAGYHQ